MSVSAIRPLDHSYAHARRHENHTRESLCSRITKIALGIFCIFLPQLFGTANAQMRQVVIPAEGHLSHASFLASPILVQLSDSEKADALRPPPPMMARITREQRRQQTQADDIAEYADDFKNIAHQLREIPEQEGTREIRAQLVNATARVNFIVSRLHELDDTPQIKARKGAERLEINCTCLFQTMREAANRFPSIVDLPKGKIEDVQRIIENNDKDDVVRPAMDAITDEIYEDKMFQKFCSYIAQQRDALDSMPKSSHEATTQKAVIRASKQDLIVYAQRYHAYHQCMSNYANETAQACSPDKSVCEKYDELVQELTNLHRAARSQFPAIVMYRDPPASDDAHESPLHLPSA